MTICIAALCTWPGAGLMIVGASDRMLSAPDIKFEPPQRKIYQFTPDVVALVAGDPSAQIIICNTVARVMEVRRLQNRAVDTVEGIARLYSDAFTGYRRELAENRYLKPLGLDVNEFLTRQSELRGDLVGGLVSDMQRQPLDCEALIVGKDATGHHIYSVSDPGDVNCADAIAFASIGSGKHHADLQFMLAKHTKQTPFHTALLQTYIAKKRAQVSPTVGDATDLFYIGAANGFNNMPDDIAVEIDRIWARFDVLNTAAQAQADSEASDCVNNHINQHAQSAQAPSPSPSPNSEKNIAAVPKARRTRKGARKRRR